MWVAPAKGSGCVRLSAMIYEGKDSWYADAGGLSKIVCEQKEDKTKKSMSEDECCACDEAKYSVSFLSFTFKAFISALNNSGLLFVFHSSLFLILHGLNNQRKRRHTNRSLYSRESGRMRLIPRTIRSPFGWHISQTLWERHMTPTSHSGEKITLQRTVFVRWPNGKHNVVVLQEFNLFQS